MISVSGLRGHVGTDLTPELVARHAAALGAWVRSSGGKRVVLVSATPLNNTPQDILSQIKLFQPGKNSTIPNVRNLEAFFGALRRRLEGLDRQHRFAAHEAAPEKVFPLPK